MTKGKKILILFITIISSALILNLNVFAAGDYQETSGAKITKVERQETAITGWNEASGSIGYSTTTTSGSSTGYSTTTTSGNGNSQVITSNGAISGYTCNQFNVSYKETIPNRPYISNQGNILYNVEGCGLDLTAFCLDPNLDGVYAKDGVQAYNASPIELDTEYGKRLLALYKLYNGGKDPQTVFTYQAAARLLMYSEGSDYMSKRNVVKGRLNSHLDVYKSIGGAGAIGSVGAEAANLATQAIEMAKTFDSNKDTTVGISVSQVGGAKKYGSGYSITLNVTIQNYKPSFTGSLSINGASIISQSEEVTDNAKIYTVEIYVASFDGGECGSASLEATYTYNNPDDLRHAYIISPNAQFGLAHQNFAVFAANNDQIQVKNGFTVSNNDGDNCHPDDKCKPNGVLTCDANDGKIVYVTDGSMDGDDKHTSDEEWDSCIIGQKDSAGNSYDVVNTSQMQAREEEDEEDTQLNLITGITTYGEEIKDSDYCQISCREKYSFMLPGYKEDVKQGTYFEFHTDGNKTTHAVVGVGAERLCVSKSIENDKFNKRVLNLRQQQVDYLNVALFYQQLYNAMYSEDIMQEYKDTKKDSTCDGWTDTPKGKQIDGYDKYDIKDCAGVKSKANPDLSKTKILPLFNSTKSGKFTYYTIKNYGSDAENLKHFDLEKHETTLNLAKSFADNIHNNFNAPTTAQWYEKTYSDSAKMTEVMSTVAEFAGDKETNVEVTHTWCETTKKEWDYSNCKEGEDKNDCKVEVEKCDTTDNHKDKVKVTYIDGTQDEAIWESFDLNTNIYKKYKETLDKIYGEYEKAIEKYNALNAQIGIQSDSMQECTNFLETIGDTKLAYHFGPEITFSYQEENYMAMLKPNKLVDMDDTKEYKVNYKLYFCENDTTTSGVFGCAGEGGTSTEFKFGVNDGIPGIKNEKSTSLTDAANKLIIKDGEELGKDTTNYYNAKRVGSRAVVGEYNSTHGQCNKDDLDSDCFYFYRSAKPFYTAAQDGLASTEKSGKNKNILDTDGYVYPVAMTTKEGKYEYTIRFSNIGNYFGTTALGRLMGDGNAILSGKAQDALVCNYEVERVDKKPCYDKDKKKHYIPDECNDGESSEECEARLCPDGDTPPPTDDDYYCLDKDVKHYIPDECKDNESTKECEARLCPNGSNGGECDKIYEKDCNNGAVGSIQSLSDKAYLTCLSKLLDAKEDCCSDVDKLMAARAHADGSTYHGSIPTSLYDIYEQRCDNKNNCQGFTIVGTSDVFENETDNALVLNDGSLQLNPRTVSLNNIFPNNQKGINWLTSEAKTIKTEIEQIGDGIFGRDFGETHGLDYQVILTPTCASAIRDYNYKQSGENNSNNAGGFNDYTLEVIDSTTEAYTNVDEKGRTAVMGDAFLKVLKENCSEGLQIKSKPDKINDSSKVES